MGFIKHFNTKEEYTVEGLYEKIKDCEFSAGVPTVDTTLGNPSIVFPKLDEFNQIWIAPSGLSSTGTWKKWAVFKSVHDAGAANVVGHMALSHFLPFTTGYLSYGSKNSKEAFALVDKTIEEITKLDI